MKVDMNALTLATIKALMDKKVITIHEVKAIHDSLMASSIGKPVSQVLMEFLDEYASDE